MKFYNVEELCADKINEMLKLVPEVKNSRVSIGAFYRLLIPQILPDTIDKIIYFDSDIVVNLDIKELWQIELSDKPIAAAPEIEIDTYRLAFSVQHGIKYLIDQNFVAYEDYFNSGVMLMDLNFFRNADKFLMDGVKWRGEHPQCTCFDQDIFNYLFSKNYLKLPERFDVFIDVERTKFSNLKIRPAIYHYAVNALNLNTNDLFNWLWIEDFIKTQWFDAEAIGRLYDGFRQNQIEFKDTMIKFSSALSGKTRAFIVSSEYFEAVKTIFSVRSDEEIITINSTTIKLEDLVDAMNTVASRGKKIFIVMVPNFAFDTFEQFGFVYGENIFNGFDFLSEKYGVPTNSYPLIKAM